MLRCDPERFDPIPVTLIGEATTPTQSKRASNVSGIQLGIVLADGSFTQEGARKLPHSVEDAGYSDCVVCVCGTGLRACQSCCELIHEDEAIENRHGDPVCAKGGCV